VRSSPAANCPRLAVWRRRSGLNLCGFTQPSRHGRKERIDRRFVKRRVLTAPKSHCGLDQARVWPARAHAAPSSFDPSTSTAANRQARHAFKTE
jgi:hypothetical protein